jgi:hypothetical protein
MNRKSGIGFSEKIMLKPKHSARYDSTKVISLQVRGQRATGFSISFFKLSRAGLL